MDYFILFSSFLVATIVSVWILINTNNKLFSRLSAFLVNTVILVVSTWGLTITDEEARVFGNVPFIFVISIPLITWMNFFILEFIKYRRKGTKVEA